MDAVVLPRGLPREADVSPASNAGQPILRLVRGGDFQEATGSRLASGTEASDSGFGVRSDVAWEVRAASVAHGLDPTDPRWVLAAATHEQLQGAALSPGRRDGLRRLANRLGLRPFDAAMIIAIVQDEARRGEVHDPPQLYDRLRIVHRPEADTDVEGSAAFEEVSKSARRGGEIVGYLMAAGAIAAVMLMAMLKWLAG